MPAIITHHLFGRSIAADMTELWNASTDEMDAFLLGNQGPDVLFFAAGNPAALGAWNLGSDMHRADPIVLLTAFRDAALSMSGEYRGVGISYVLGLLGHYLLDSTLHPYIYALQGQICGAGIEGLDDTDGHEVHAEIESELDVLVLSRMLGRTIESFAPPDHILLANERTVLIISMLYKKVSETVFGQPISERAYAAGLDAYRALLRVLYSPKGMKRKILGMAERVFRRHSFAQAMSHRNEIIEHSIFDNEEHRPWIDPDSGEVSESGFWDLYEEARTMMLRTAPTFMDATPRELEDITRNLDFNGVLTRARIIRVQ